MTAVVVGAIVGAVVGGATSAITQQVTTGTIDWGKVGISTLAGAAGGALGGGVGAALTSTMTAGASALVASSLSLGQTVGVGAVSAMSAGVASRVVENAAYNSSASVSDQFGYVYDPKSMAMDAVVGGGTAGILYGADAWANSRANQGIEPINPLQNIKYTEKVRGQMDTGDYHSFPKSVDAFGGTGEISELVGADKIARTKVAIYGSYRGKDGIFEYIIEPNGKDVNHRYFNIR